MHRNYLAACRLSVASNQSLNVIKHSSTYSKYRYKYDETFNKSWERKWLIFGTVAGSVGVGLYIHYNKNGFYAWLKSDPDSVGKFNKKYNSYTLQEVNQHSEKSKKIWVTYKEGVYDITEFIDKHPGGDKIMMAAGGSVEPFWLLYGVHKSPEILEMLEKYRIGNLDKKDAEAIMTDVADPYGKDPIRHPALQPSSVKPYNAEPPPSLLVDSYITPNDLFYVRNHLPVPDVDVNSYRLQVSIDGVDERSLSLQNIKTKFKKYTVTATIQCAGNRRGEMVKIKPVKGLNWGHAAIGNATWSGAKLTDVLEYCGYKHDDKYEHVQFEGLDLDPASFPYGASIPIEKALDPHGDVILAYEMNGEELSKDHGYPIRVIVPGVVGARNVKWLGKIILSDVESDAHWQQNDYKGFNPSVDWDTVDFKLSPAIQELPVISAICAPEDKATAELKDGKLTIQGYAWSGGGRKIVRVDVTVDNGKQWTSAKLEQNKDKHPHHWGWTLWTVEIPIEKNKKQVEIWAKAVDSSYNTQPETFENIWNLRGVLGNAYHKIKIDVKPERKR